MSREIFDLPPYSEIWKDTKKRTPLGERELLVHALDRLKHINFEDDHLTNDLIQTIQKYLDQPEHTEQEQEPVGYLYKQMDCTGEWATIFKVEKPYITWHDTKDIVTLYTSPPKREPLSDEEIYTRCCAMGGSYTCNFIDGVEWAEHQHGIRSFDDE